MSRMTKFLKQTCLFSAAVRDTQDVIQLNRYGEVEYEEPIQLSCRRERTVKDVLTSNGAVMKSTARYFLDESVVIQADDKLDGRTVLSVAEYTNQLGLTEGFECYV